MLTALYTIGYQNMTFFFGFFHAYGLLIGLGIGVGLYVIYRASRFFGQDPKWVDASFPWIFVGAVIGARLYHLLTDWQVYTHASVLDLIAVWRGGIGFLGAIVGGYVGLWLWTKRDAHKKLRAESQLFLYLDLLAFGIPVAQAIGRTGNYVNQELFGLPTNLPWGIVVNGQRYHPLFVYEAILNIFLLCILLAFARKKSLVLGKGQYISVYLFGYSFIRFWLEFLRIETARLDGVLGIFSIAQWVTLIMMIAATILFWVRRHVPKKGWDFTLE